MGPKEVVMRDDEGDEGDRTVEGLESGGGTDVELDCAVKPFDDLFKMSEFGGDFVEILKADDLVKSDLMILITFFVEEHHASSIRRVCIGNECEFLVGIGGADGFVHGDGGRQSFAIIRDVIRRDGVFLSRCE